MTVLIQQLFICILCVGLGWVLREKFQGETSKKTPTKTTPQSSPKKISSKETRELQTWAKVAAL